MIELHVPTAYKQGTRLMYEAEMYEVTACLNLSWLFGESNRGFLLVMKRIEQCLDANVKP